MQKLSIFIFSIFRCQVQKTGKLLALGSVMFLTCLILPFFLSDQVYLELLEKANAVASARVEALLQRKQDVQDQLDDIQPSYQQK